MSISHLEIRQKLAAAKATLDAAEQKAREERQQQIDAAHKMRAEYLEAARRCLHVVNDAEAEIHADANVVKANEALEAAIEEAKSAGVAPASYGEEADLLCCTATNLPLLHGDEVFGDPYDGFAILKSVVSTEVAIEGGQPVETYTITVNDDEEAEEEDATGDI